MEETNTQAVDPTKKAAYKRSRILAAVAMYSAAILAVLCLIGIVVSVLLLNFGAQSKAKNDILYILTGTFAGGAVLMSLCTYLFSKLMHAIAARELDLRERLDSEESFFVGEGTLMTFGENGLTLHSEAVGNSEPVLVPYHETRYISICTRRRAQEKGSWCVAIEIPVKYLARNIEGKEHEKVLVQADGKERLYQALKKHNLTLLGEERQEGKENKKFIPVQKFTLPNRKKRRNALIMLALGGVLAGGSVPLALFVSAPIGALAGAVGLLLLLRAIMAFLKAKAVFGVYQEGVFWRESSGKESLFLKWGDIEKVLFGEQNGYPVVTFYCSYGRYAIPAVEGAYECIEKLQKEKCGREV